MNELEFARSFLVPYKTEGDEIIPRYCPFCGGGEHRDRDTFALNYRNHTYNCKRGKCQERGHFSQLCKRFGVEMDVDETYLTPVVRREYKRPEVKPEPATDKVREYLHKRGLIDDTLTVFGVASHDGNIMFPYYRTMEEFSAQTPTFIKYRKPEKYTGNGQKMWRERGAEPILFGMHLCRMSDPRLYITEGEWDCLCAYQCTGFNCVSVPSGSKDFSWIETCGEWLKQFEEIAVFADNDEPGKQMLSELSRKLDCKVLKPDFTLYGGCKDANEILVRQGPEAVKTIMLNMSPVGVVGLLNIADIPDINLAELPRTFTGLQSIDKAFGGMLAGDLSVWTGKRGSGKSTLLQQVLLNAVNDGVNVCIYSGEIPAERLKNWLKLQAAGSQYVQERTDERTGRQYGIVPFDVSRKIIKWLNGKVWIYDNKLMEPDETKSILRLFELAYKRYDCRVFLVDNLMIVNSSANDREVMQAQANFTIQLRKLADKLGVHIHLVVHPRKTGRDDVSDSDDVGGMGTITNVASNVFSVKRVKDPKEIEMYDCDNMVKCMKNRAYGDIGDVRLDYSPLSRRFVDHGAEEKVYNWTYEQVLETEREAPPF